MIIKVETLNRMFEQNNTANHCNYKGRCHYCGCDVEVQITKIAGGYGLLRGVLFEPNPQNFVVLCADCYEKSGKQTRDHLYSTSPAI